MIFEKKNLAHKVVYRICGMQFVFLKRYALLFRYAKILKNLKYHLMKAFYPNFDVKKYKYFIPFGMCCDFSTRFLHYFKFSDSTFWNWVWADVPEIQMEFWEHPEILFSEGQFFSDYANGMWVCKKTGMRFHSKNSYNFFLKNDGSLDEKLLEEDFEELSSRTKYLYEKTKRYLELKDKKLFTYTLRCSDYKNMTFHVNRIKSLYDFIAQRTENFDFLLVVAKQNYEFVKTEIEKTHPQIFVRQVRSYYRGIQDLSLDRLGWVKIFKEFQPVKIIKSKYKKTKYNQLEVNKLNV